MLLFVIVIIILFNHSFVLYAVYNQSLVCLIPPTMSSFLQLLPLLSLLIVDYSLFNVVGYFLCILCLFVHGVQILVWPEISNLAQFEFQNERDARVRFIIFRTLLQL